MRSNGRWTFVLLLLVASAAHTAADTSILGDWQQVATQGNRPLGRGWQSAIYDPTGHRMIIFGGWSSTPYNSLNDIWQLDLSNDTWTQLFPSGSRPGTRAAHVGVYDSRRHRMIIHGGNNWWQTWYRDTWAYDLTTNTWTQLATSGAPSYNRFSHAGVYDPVRDRLVVFGGLCGSVSSNWHSNDVWALDLTSLTWSQLFPGGTPPSPRQSRGIYDVINDRMIVGDGGLGLGGATDLWALDFSANQWIQLASPPGDFAKAGFAIDPSRRLIAYTNGLGAAGDRPDRSLVYDVAANSWPTPNILGPYPPQYSGEAVSLVFDPSNGRFVQFGGGYSLRQTFNDTWALSLCEPEDAPGGGLQLNKQVIGRISAPSCGQRWEFAAVAGQQVRLQDASASEGSVVFYLTGQAGWVGFEGIAGTSDPVTLPASGTYALTAWSSGDATYTFRLQQATVTDLSLGTAHSGTLLGDGQAELFRMDVPQGTPMHVVLSGLAADNNVEVYVRFGLPPTRGQYDYRSTPGVGADHRITIPMAAAGSWYVLVYGETIATPGSYTLLANSSGVVLTSVTPSYHTNAVAAMLTLTGAGFDATTQIELVDSGGSRYAADTVEVDSFERLRATFAAGAVPAGTYSVVASEPDGSSDELTDAFEMTAGVGAKLETNLVLPRSVGYHALATIWVEYKNTGGAAMPAPLLVLTASQKGNERAFLTLLPTRLVEGFWTSAIPEGFSHSVQLLASGDTPGVLQPGESLRVPVYYAGWQQPWDFSYPPINWNLGVLQADDTTPVDWAALKAGMQPETMSADAWDVVFAGFTSQVGATWGDYVRMLGDNAAYLGRLGERVVDVGQLLAFEFLQAEGLNPSRTLASAVDGAVEAPGLPLVFSRSFPASISQRFEIGPFGRGWSHNWQYSLSVAADGTVTMTGPGGSRRVFQPDSRYSGRYFAQAGDHATLTPLGGGAFSLREPAGLLRVFRADGKLDYAEDPNGNRITCGYSGNLLTSLTHSSGQYLQVTYSGAGRIQTITDNLGRQTTFSYDGANERLGVAQYYDGRSANYTYNLSAGPAQHALTRVDNSCCNHRYFDFDPQGRLAGTHLEGNAEAVSFTYGTAGKVTVTDALGGASRFYFDHRGLLVKSEDPLGHAVHLDFDDNYNLVRLTDPAGRSYDYAYDGWGNLIRSRDPLGNTTRFYGSKQIILLCPLTQACLGPNTWPLGRVVDARGNMTSYSYDSHDNLTAITYADGSHEDWAYDAPGNATSWTNRRGNAISYTYNASGRLTSKTFADGSRAEYAYDARGNLTSATTLDPGLSPLETSVMTYDGNDRLTNITATGGKWLSFTYDAAGRRASSVDQLGHQLTYSYDAAGRLESLTNELAQVVVQYEYDAAGRLGQKTLANGMVAAYEYDAAGQLLTLENRLADGTPISWFNYTYDTRGRRTAMATHYGTWAYEYDDLGQLTRAVLASTDPQIPNQDLAYVYDGVGNRTRTVENAVTIDYTANNLNQYVTVGNTSYVFDLDGNLIQETSLSGTTTYTYNDENRLTAVHKGTDTWEYAYDASGNRVGTTANGATKRFVIDPTGLGNLVGEYDGTGNLIAHYDHGAGLLARTDAGGDRGYYAFDAIGNAHQLLATTGAVANAYAYEPFGSLLKVTETISQPFQFVGQLGVMKQTANMHFMRKRTYSSSSGSFMSSDPLGIRGGDVNLQRYAGNNPISGSDPIGLTNWDDIDVQAALLRRTAKTWPRILKNYTQPDEAGYIHQENAGYTLIFLHSEFGLLFEHETMRHETIHYLDFLYPSFRFHRQYFDEYHAYSVENDYLDRHGYMEKYGWGRWRFPLPEPEFFRNPLASGASGVSASVDPNAKTGPAGFGASGLIAASSPLAYQVDFENEAGASAPAQIVTVTDQLDGDLDWPTFELTEIGFGDVRIAIPDNTQHFETTVPMAYGGVEFEVQVEAGIHVGSGQVYANFYSIDPATGLPPPVDIGFLPPEDDTGRGQGYFAYVIKPKDGLPAGTDIRNIAYITFDYQETIATNQVDPHDPSQGTDPEKEAYNTIGDVMWEFFGNAQGGTIDFTVDGVALQIVTSTGQTPEQIASNVATAINNHPTLPAGGASAAAIGNGVVINGTVDGIRITDPGLTYRATPSLHLCGDGVVDTGEGCDDGNIRDGDGCSATCQVETASTNCLHGIALHARRLGTKRLWRMQGCLDKVAGGKLACVGDQCVLNPGGSGEAVTVGSTCGTAADCCPTFDHVDPAKTTQAKLSKDEAKAASYIRKRCSLNSGPDGEKGTDDDTYLDPQTLGFATTCLDVLGQCGPVPVDELVRPGTDDDLIDCIECTTAAVTDDMLDFHFPLAADDDPEVTCQRVLGKQGSKLARTRMIRLQKCLDTVVNAKLGCVNNQCVLNLGAGRQMSITGSTCGVALDCCPGSDHTNPGSTTQAKMDKDTAKALINIQKSCSLADGPDGQKGTEDDTYVDALALGFGGMCLDTIGQCGSIPIDAFVGPGADNDLLECLVCATDSAAEELTNFYFGLMP